MGTFATLKTELLARGFDYLTDTRAGQFVNDAYHEVCEAANWPFLEATTSGTAPLTIADVREVLYVIDTTSKTKLRSQDVRTVTDEDPDFTAAGVPVRTGTPYYWWLDGSTTLRVYPANTTDTLAVRYLKVPADLTGTDTPVLPTRYHSLIVDVAQALVNAKDTSGQADYSLVRPEIERVVGRMAGVLLNRPLDNPPETVLTEPKDY